jgi:glycosyltransferase involved in cell wall biosynthesis
VTKPRVLWLIKGLGLGGAERLMVSMASRFDRERFELEVAHLLPDSEFAPALHRLGIPITCLEARSEVELGWPRGLRRLLRAGSFDLVHTHSPLPAAAARLLAGRGPRFVHTEHNLWSSYRTLTYVANAVTFGRNRVGLAVSDAVRDSMVRPWWLGGRQMPPVETLLHGVDTSEVHRGPAARAHARELLGIEAHTPVIGTVASFTPQKDHAGLLEAMLEIRCEIPRATWVLIGTGPLEPEIRARVVELGLTEHVRFTGPRTDVARLLPGLDAFVLGSRFEGLPIALLEAMASQVACVVTRVGGVPQAVTDGIEGLLVPPGQPAALAAAVLTVLRDDRTRVALAAAAARRVEADFSIDRTARDTEALYDRVLAQRFR